MLTASTSSVHSTVVHSTAVHVLYLIVFEVAATEIKKLLFNFHHTSVCWFSLSADRKPGFALIIEHIMTLDNAHYDAHKYTLTGLTC